MFVFMYVHLLLQSIPFHHHTLTLALPHAEENTYQTPPEAAGRRGDDGEREGDVHHWKGFEGGHSTGASDINFTGEPGRDNSANSATAAASMHQRPTTTWSVPYEHTRTESAILLLPPDPIPYDSDSKILQSNGGLIAGHIGPSVLQTLGYEAQAREEKDRAGSVCNFKTDGMCDTNSQVYLQREQQKRSQETDQGNWGVPESIFTKVGGTEKDGGIESGSDFSVAPQRRRRVIGVTKVSMYEVKTSIVVPLGRTTGWWENKPDGHTTA